MLELVATIRAEAVARGMAVHFGFSRFEHNISTGTGYAPGELILTYDVKFTPRLRNSVWIGGSGATTLLAVGRKFDADGTAADLNETDEQKYDRRFAALGAALVELAGGVGCSTGYMVDFGTLTFERDMYDTDIDFAICEVTYTQR